MAFITHSKMAIDLSQLALPHLPLSGMDLFSLVVNEVIILISQIHKV